MRKVLPLNRNAEKFSECWTHMRLAFILTRQECYSWYCGVFNNYYIENKNFSVEFDNSFTSSYFDIYKSILIEKNLIVDSKLCGNIVDVIKNNGYAIVFCNYEYLLGEKSDFINHEVLVYGYDEEAKTFLLYLHYRNKWMDMEIKQDKIKKAVYYAITNQDDYFLRSIRFELPCIAYFFRGDIDENINYKNMFFQITKYIEGGTYSFTSCQNVQWIPQNKRLVNSKIYFGTAVYDAYREELYKRIVKDENTIRDYLFRGIEHLIASKKELENKIRYIGKRCQYNELYEFSTRNVVNKLIIFRNNLIKYYYNKDIKNLNKAIRMLDEIQEVDREVYFRVLDYFMLIIENQISYKGE